MRRTLQRTGVIDKIERILLRDLLLERFVLQHMITDNLRIFPRRGIGGGGYDLLNRLMIYQLILEPANAPTGSDCFQSIHIKRSF